jgi:prepilin-type processing-associated H-X9-DG protein
MVSLSIITMLLAITLPAIFSARESARRMQCLTNLRQMGQAAQNFASAHDNRFPRTSTNGSDSQGREILASVSPHRYLLPHLDQSPLYAKIDFQDMSINFIERPPEFFLAQNELLEASVPVFLCPSDFKRIGATNYRANMGDGPHVYGPEPPAIAGFAGNVAGAFVHGRSVRLSQFRDGLSNTVLFSEKLIGDGNPGRYTPWTDFFYFRSGDFATADETVLACRSLSEPNPPHASYAGWTWVFGGWNSTWYNHILPPNSPIPDCSQGGIVMAGGGSGAYAARSYHKGGVNAVFGDGSGRFISQQIDISVWRAISTRAEGEPVGDAF